MSLEFDEQVYFQLAREVVSSVPGDLDPRAAKCFFEARYAEIQASNESHGLNTELVSVLYYLAPLPSYFVSPRGFASQNRAIWGWRAKPPGYES